MLNYEYDLMGPGSDDARITTATEKPSVLVIDDDPTILHAVGRLLSERFRVSVALTGKAGLALAAEHRPELILLDVEIPDLDGYTVCRSLKANAITKDIPVVFLTTHDDEESEVLGLEVGGSDFMSKPLRGCVVLARLDNLVRIKRLGERLLREAKTDYLTGLANRAELDRVLDLEVRRSNRNGQALSLLMIDVDYFKAYNDHCGHLEGDRILQQLSSVFRHFAGRPADLTARYGGEEFVTILPETDGFGAACLARRMTAAVENLGIPHPGSPVSRFVTVSVGCSAFHQHTLMNVSSAGEFGGTEYRTTSDELLKHADRAMYAAKNNGRHQAWSLPIGEFEPWPIHDVCRHESERCHEPTG